MSSPPSTTSLDARQSCWAMVVSMVVHLTLLTALGLTWMPQRTSPPSRPLVQTEWSDVPVPLPDVEMELERPMTLTASAGGGGPGEHSLRIPIPSHSHVSIPLSRLPDFRTPEFGDSPFSAADLVTSVTGSGGGSGSTAGPGSGGGRGGGQGRGTGTGVGDGSGDGVAVGNFFSVDKPDGRYVFVVDSSRSMNHRWHGPAKSRFGRVKVELWRTIYQMAPEQKYFIIFFNTRAIPMPAEGLIAGGTANQTTFLQWTSRIRADGQTDPQQALLMALQMRPDVIYFLTDGEFNYRVVRDVSAANFGNVRIHTISLGDDSGEAFLKELAARNGGVYRHIAEAADQYWITESTEDTTSETSVAPPKGNSSITPASSTSLENESNPRRR